MSKHQLPPPSSFLSKRSHFSISKSISDSFNQIEKSIVKAESLANHEQLKTERKLQKLKIQEEQFMLQQEIEKAEVLEKLEDTRQN